jgi:NADPH:quinone reductase
VQVVVWVSRRCKSRAMGLRVFGTAGTPKGLDIAKQEGAHQVFDHRKAGYQEEIVHATDNRGVDIILEMLANVNLAYDTKLLANNGRVIVIGSRGEVTINPRELMARRASIRAFTLWAITAAEEADIHAGLFAGLENGTLRPVVGKELPLAEASRAHKEILEPGAAGGAHLLIEERCNAEPPTHMDIRSATIRCLMLVQERTSIKWAARVAL